MTMFARVVGYFLLAAALVFVFWLADDTRETDAMILLGATAFSLLSGLVLILLAMIAEALTGRSGDK